MSVRRGIIVIDDQQDANFDLFICTQSVVHVSDDVFAHHQEHLILFTASDYSTYLAAGLCHGRDGTRVSSSS